MASGLEKCVGVLAHANTSLHCMPDIDHSLYGTYMATSIITYMVRLNIDHYLHGNIDYHLYGEIEH